MIHIYRPEEEADFTILKEGDNILVEWSDNYLKHHHDARKISLYRVASINQKTQEVICQAKLNHYFNYRLYCEGKSPSAVTVLILATRDYLDAVVREEAHCPIFGEEY